MLHPSPVSPDGRVAEAVHFAASRSAFGFLAWRKVDGLAGQLEVR